MNHRTKLEHDSDTILNHMYHAAMLAAANRDLALHHIEKAEAMLHEMKRYIARIDVNSGEVKK